MAYIVPGISEQNVQIPSSSVSWTKRQSGTNATLRSVKWYSSLGLFIAVGNSGTILTSTNGSQWYSRDSSTTSNLYDSAIDTGNIVAIGPGESVVSTNGTTWAQTAGNPNGGCVKIFLEWSGQVLQAPSYSSWVSTSSNYGASWGGTNPSFNAYAGDRGDSDNFREIYAGANGVIRYPQNGGSWYTVSTWGTKPTIRDIRNFGAGDFLCVGDNGFVGRSTDTMGTTMDWVAIDIGTTENLTWCGKSSNGTYAIVGANGTLYTSTNTTTWIKQDIKTTNTIRGMCWSTTNGIFVLVGDNGVIVTGSDTNPAPEYTTLSDIDVRVRALENAETITLGYINDATSSITGDKSIYKIGIDTTATTIVLTSAGLNSQTSFTIKDGIGNASANNITIVTENSETIDGTSSIAITSDYGSVTLFNDGYNWFTI